MKKRLTHAPQQRFSMQKKLLFCLVPAALLLCLGIFWFYKNSHKPVVDNPAQTTVAPKTIITSPADVDAAVETVKGVDPSSVVIPDLNDIENTML